MRITFLISSLGAGGAERVMATMANHWAAHGRSVTILTLAGDTTPPFYDLHPAITYRSLGGQAPSSSPLTAIARNLHRLWTVGRAVRASRGDVLISFMDSTNVLAIAVGRALRVPTIVAEHTDPAQYSSGRAWRALRRIAYPRAARLVVLSETARDYFPVAIRHRAQIIPNPIVVPNPGAALRPAPASPPFRLIGVGRLSPEKGFDLLIRAFARIAADVPDWTLTIWGEGPERPALEALRAALGLDGRVEFPGRTAEPHARMAEAHLFALSSRFEGFPMALGEAMAVGLPVVAVDCPSGPRQLIRPGVDGLLLPPGDEAALAAGLAGLMTDGDERRRLAERAPEVIERFGVERVMTIWDDLLRDAGVRPEPAARPPSDR